MSSNVCSRFIYLLSCILVCYECINHFSYYLLLEFNGRCTIDNTKYLAPKLQKYTCHIIRMSVVYVVRLVVSSLRAVVLPGFNSRSR